MSVPQFLRRSTVIALTFVVFAAVASQLHARDFMVVAYNVENLFDVDGIANYEDFKPDKYGSAQLSTKVRNAAGLLAKFNGGKGPDVLIVDEVEIDFTSSASKRDYAGLLKKYSGTTVQQMLSGEATRDVADLPAEFFLLKELTDLGAGPYHLVIGGDSPGGGDRQSTIKCTLFSVFPILETRSHPTQSARDVLEVKLDVEGHPLYIFANHWKSGASDPGTEPTRVQNAGVLRAQVDRILSGDPHADIIIGGDLNSQYNQSVRYPQMRETGINTVLGSQGNELAVRGADRPLYNLWYELKPENRASDLYRDEWGTLMHIIVSRGLYDYRGVQYIDNSFGVAKVEGVNADATGRPIRWSNHGSGSGFSDHFPLFARFTTVPDNDASRWLALRNPSTQEETGANVQRINYASMDLTQLAVKLSEIPSGTNLRDGTWNRKIFHVEGKVVGERPFTIEFRGENWEVFSHNKELRTEFYKSHKIGDRVRFYGELGTYQGRWQFVIPDKSWIR
jgi:hypothetical protein